MYTVSVSCTLCLCHVHRICAMYTVSVPCTPCLCHVHRVCAMYTVSVPCTLCLCHVHRVCAMYTVSLSCFSFHCHCRFGEENVFIFRSVSVGVKSLNSILGLCFCLEVSFLKPFLYLNSQKEYNKLDLKFWYLKKLSFYFVISWDAWVSVQLCTITKLKGNNNCFLYTELQSKKLHWITDYGW
jgi:hypothetical protein